MILSFLSLKLFISWKSRLLDVWLLSLTLIRVAWISGAERNVADGHDLIFATLLLF